MNLFGVMQVSGAGLQVQRVRAEVVATNMANAETTRTEDGTPYQRRQVVLQAGDGNGFAPMGQSTVTSLAGASFGSSFSAGLTGTGMAGMGTSGTPAVSVADVVQSTAPPLQRYDPTHPDADSNGYVSYPDINPLTEMVDLVGASRAYSLNASALQAEKGMLTASLDILK